MILNVLSKMLLHILPSPPLYPPGSQRSSATLSLKRDTTVSRAGGNCFQNAIYSSPMTGSSRDFPRLWERCFTKGPAKDQYPSISPKKTELGERESRSPSIQLHAKRSRHPLLALTL